MALTESLAHIGCSRALKNRLGMRKYTLDGIHHGEKGGYSRIRVPLLYDIRRVILRGAGIIVVLPFQIGEVQDSEPISPRIRVAEVEEASGATHGNHLVLSCNADMVQASRPLAECSWTDPVKVGEGENANAALGAAFSITTIGIAEKGVSGQKISQRIRCDRKRSESRVALTYISYVPFLLFAPTEQNSDL